MPSPIDFGREEHGNKYIFKWPEIEQPPKIEHITIESKGITGIL